MGAMLSIVLIVGSPMPAVIRSYWRQADPEAPGSPPRFTSSTQAARRASTTAVGSVDSALDVGFGVGGVIFGAGVECATFKGAVGARNR